MLLIDTLPFEYNIIEEGVDKSKKFKIYGIFQRADTINENKRIYPLKILEREVARLQPLIQERRLLGELDHPQTKQINLDRVSHLITKLELRNNEVWGEAEILDGMPYGQMLKALLENKIKLGISSRGEGETRTNPEGIDEVLDNYELITFDIVHKPSTPGAFPKTIVESENLEKEKKQNKKIIITLEDIYKEIFK